MLRALGYLIVGLLSLWAFAATYVTLRRAPDDKQTVFWWILPFILVAALTVFVVKESARHSVSLGRGFSWFAVALGASASIGLAAAYLTASISLICWIYTGSPRG